MNSTTWAQSVLNVIGGAVSDVAIVDLEVVWHGGGGVVYLVD